MFFFFHKLLMALAALCILTGISAAVFFRQRRYWLKVHKVFNSLAGIFLTVAAAMAITAVELQNGKHLDGFHPLTGSITLLLTIISLFLGFYQFQAAKNRIQVFRAIHRRLGRLTLLLIIVALASGLIRAVII